MSVDIDAYRKWHTEGINFCKGKCSCCVQEWPCPTIQLCDAVDQERCKHTASQEALTEFLTEHREYAEEIARLR